MKIKYKAIKTIKKTRSMNRQKTGNEFLRHSSALITSAVTSSRVCVSEFVGVSLPISISSNGVKTKYLKILLVERKFEKFFIHFGSDFDSTSNLRKIDSIKTKVVRIHMLDMYFNSLGTPVPSVGILCND
jgi:hypothetical protein